MADEWKILNDKLNLLIREQERFQREIKDIKTQLETLKPKEDSIPILAVIEPEIKPEVSVPVFESKPQIIIEETPEVDFHRPISQNQKLEKFIGENLISKIGIIILILGVGIGAKYAIDHELISPLTRIILGYLLGFGLLAFALKLKENYHQFSAVLLSGSMAINYFLTYAAYSIYELLPQSLAFLLMVIFTVFTVLASLRYNLQLIAHIGLVGAYAVPFLLSNGSGKVGILFSYVGMINLGILFIAYKRYWKQLYLVAYILTWLIFSSWFVFSYRHELHQWLAFGFATLFYLTFYGMFLVYKIIINEKFEPKQVLLVLSNSFIFFGFGYEILDHSYSTNDFLGLFTVFNGLIHFVVSSYIKKKDLADKNLFVVLMGLVLVFVSIAIPIQLDGNYVTLCWAVEAALLFWLGRTRSIVIYETLSYAVMTLFFFSILEDWTSMLKEINLGQGLITLVLNEYFLVGFLASLAFAFVNYIHLKHSNDFLKTDEYKLLRDIFLVGLLFMVSFVSIAMEIVNYWNSIMYNYLFTHKEIIADSILNPMIDALRFKNIWLINFAAVYFILLTWLDFKFFTNRRMKFVLLGFNMLVSVLFLIISLFEFSELREAYLMRYLPTEHIILPFRLSIRYISFCFVLPLIFYIYKQTKGEWFPSEFYWIPELFLHLFTLWVLSSEMLHIMDILGIEGSYKLSLSILWGVYALLLVFLGISNSNKYLRYAAIGLFAFTLLKLFFYDISGLNTIGKTIVFVSLGILLLVISFLYNKNKSKLFDENTEE